MLGMTKSDNNLRPLKKDADVTRLCLCPRAQNICHYYAEIVRLDDRSNIEVSFDFVTRKAAQQ